MSNSSNPTFTPGWSLFWQEVERRCMRIALSGDESAFQGDWSHVFVESSDGPLQQFHLPKDTQVAFEEASFVAVTNTSRNYRTSQEWLTVVGQDSEGKRHAKYFKLRKVGNTYYGQGPHEIGEPMVRNHYDSQNLDYATQVLDHFLTLINTGKEVSDAE